MLFSEKYSFRWQARYLLCNVLGCTLLYISFPWRAHLLKHVDLRNTPSLELATMLIFSYAPYGLAEGLKLSGNNTYICAWQSNDKTRVSLYNRPLSWYGCSTKVWSNTRTKHTTRKSKPKLVSGPIVRVVHQSITKCHHFGNFNFYEVMYGEWASLPCSVHLPYKT